MVDMPPPMNHAECINKMLPRVAAEHRSPLEQNIGSMHLIGLRPCMEAGAEFPPDIGEIIGQTDEHRFIASLNGTGGIAHRDRIIDLPILIPRSKHLA